MQSVLNTEEAAKILKVKVATLEQWRWNGKGPRFLKLGRAVRYRQEDLAAFMEVNACTSTAQANVVHGE
jgi:excisionase family DNA binding protein